MTISNEKWFEIWYSEGQITLPTHLLVVVFDKNSEEIRILDPFKGYQESFRSKNYDEICSWLWEDEYILVEGRTYTDDLEFYRNQQ